MARQTPLSCPGHTRPVVQLHYSDVTPSGFYFISACKDGKPMLRQGDTGDWIGTFEGHKGAVWGACLTKDASNAGTGAADFTAKFWDTQTGSVLCTYGHQHIVKAVDFSEDGKQLLTGCNDKSLRVFDTGNDSSKPAMTMEGHCSAIKCAVWGNSLHSLVSSSDDPELRFWDIRSAKCIYKTELISPATSMELSRDGAILTVSNNKRVSFFNTSSFEMLKSISVPALAYSASLHPDKSTFVAGGEDFKIYKFSFEDGKELESYKGHFGPVHCVRYSPDGEVYCSGSEDGTIRLWLNTVGKTYGLWKNPGDNPTGVSVNNQ